MMRHYLSTAAAAAADADVDDDDLTAFDAVRVGQVACHEKSKKSSWRRTQSECEPLAPILRTPSIRPAKHRRLSYTADFAPNASDPFLEHGLLVSQ